MRFARSIVRLWPLYGVSGNDLRADSHHLRTGRHGRARYRQQVCNGVTAGIYWPYMQDLQEYIAKSTSDSAVPEKVTDPQVLSDIGRLMTSAIELPDAAEQDAA